MIPCRPLPALLLSVLLPSVALAQAPAPVPAPPPTPSQLDRIEHKLDELLRRIDQDHAQPPGATQGTSGVSRALDPSPAPPAVSAPASVAYKPGALAIARAAPKDESGLGEVPADSVGGFVYTGGPIPLTDIHDRGVRYSGPVGVELQGWLRAKEAGRFQIGADLAAHFGLGAFAAPVCRLQAWLEGRSLDEEVTRVANPGKQDADVTLVLGAELQPGLYRLRLWLVCTAPRDVTVTVEPPGLFNAA